MAELTAVEAEAQTLLAEHGLLPGWSFGWDRATTRFGQCDHRNKRITLSKHLTAKASDQDAEQVVLHEIAHALAGSREGHGSTWRRIAAELGYTGGRTHHQEPATERAKWRGNVPTVTKSFGFADPANRRPALNVILALIETTSLCGRCERPMRRRRLSRSRHNPQSRCQSVPPLRGGGHGRKMRGPDRAAPPRKQ